MNIIQAFKDIQSQQINGDKFEKEFDTCVNQLQKQKLSVQDSKVLIDSLQEIIPNLENQFFQNYFTQFFNFAIIIADKQVYQLLFSNNFNFDFQSPKRSNEISLFIFNKLLLSDHKFMHILISEKLLDLKPYEKKFVLLELCLRYIPLLEQKAQIFQELLPSILKNLNQGVQKYMKIRQKDSTEDDDKPLNQKGFGYNFENWTLNYLNRLIDVFYKLPEIQNLTGILTDRADPKQHIKYFVLCFVLDLSQGFIEAIQQEKLFDSKLLHTFLDQKLNGLFPKFLQNETELIQFTYEQIKFNRYQSKIPPKVIQTYSIENRLNIVAVTHLFLNAFHSDSFHRVYTLQFKRKIFLNFAYEFMEYETQKEEMIYKMVDLFSNLFKNSIPQQNTELSNFNYYDVPIQKVLLKLMEAIGRADKELQLPFLDSLKSCLSSFSAKTQFRIFSDIFKESENLDLCAFALDQFKTPLLKYLSDDSAQPNNCPFIEKKQLINLMNYLLNKGEMQSVADRHDLILKVITTEQIFRQRSLSQQSKLENHILNISYAGELNKIIQQQIEATDSQIYKFVAEGEKRKKIESEKKEKDINKHEIEKIDQQLKKIELLQFRFTQMKEVLDSINSQFIQQNIQNQ